MREAEALSAAPKCRGIGVGDIDAGKVKEVDDVGGIGGNGNNALPCAFARQVAPLACPSQLDGSVCSGHWPINGV